MSDARGVNFVVVYGDQPSHSPWMLVAVAAVVIVTSFLLAWRRAGRLDSGPPHRIVRIVRASLAFSVASTLMLAAREASRTGLGSGLFDPLLLPLIGKFALLTFVAFVLLGTADLLLDAFRPRRELGWLFFGPLFLVAFVVGILIASGWLDPVSTEGELSVMTLVPALLAAGFTWWSRLPAKNRELAHVFD